MADEETTRDEQTAEEAAPEATESSEPAAPTPADEAGPEVAAEAGAMESADMTPDAHPEVLPVSADVRRILHIEVPVIVKLADKRLPLGDIIAMSPGSIVEFARSADQPLELMVNNKTIGRGIAVKVGEKFGLRIDEITSVDATIRSLGS